MMLAAPRAIGEVAAGFPAGLSISLRSGAPPRLTMTSSFNFVASPQKL